MKSESKRNKKGILFTWDVIFSVLIAFVIVLVAFQMSSENVENFSSLVSAKRLASDIVISLDYNGTLDTLDKDVIENVVNSTLPINLDLYMRMYVFNKSMDVDQIIDIRNDIDDDYREGRWSFVKPAGTNGIEKLVLVVYKVGFK